MPPSGTGEKITNSPFIIHEKLNLLAGYEELSVGTVNQSW